MHFHVHWLYWLKKCLATLCLFFFYITTFAKGTNEALYVVHHHSKIKAVLFDTFGTVVDWRGTMVGEFQTLFQQQKIKQVDAETFVADWVNSYAENMANISQGKQPFVSVDKLNKKSLDKTLKHFSIFNHFTKPQRKNMWLIWHRLKPWPDSVAGLNALKKKFIIGALSNGNVRLLVDLSKQANLNWDLILSGEQIGYYKPHSLVYQTAAKLLNLKPEEILLVASHKFDLEAAKKCGFKTAYIFRPQEFKTVSEEQIASEKEFDYVVDAINELDLKL